MPPPHTHTRFGHRRRSPYISWVHSSHASFRWVDRSVVTGMWTGKKGDEWERRTEWRISHSVAEYEINSVLSRQSGLDVGQTCKWRQPRNQEKAIDGEGEKMAEDERIRMSRKDRRRDWNDLEEKQGTKPFWRADDLLNRYSCNLSALNMISKVWNKRGKLDDNGYHWSCNLMLGRFHWVEHPEDKYHNNWKQTLLV